MQRTAEAEPDLGGGELVGDGPGVGQGAGEAVELGDDEGVAGAAGGERLAEPGPVAVGSGQAVVDVDSVIGDAEGVQAVALGGEVLSVGGDPGLADFQFGHRAQSVPLSPRSLDWLTEPVLRHCSTCWFSFVRGGGGGCR